jgi:hypothetical protein
VKATRPVVVSVASPSIPVPYLSACSCRARYLNLPAGRRRPGICLAVTMKVQFGEHQRAGTGGPLVDGADHISAWPVNQEFVRMGR